MRKAANTIATAVGKGLIAGFAGTAAMTISSTVEARLRGRAFSTAPAKAAAKVLGITEFEDARAQARFSDLVHWGYGTGWGAVRGILRGVGFSPKLATPMHFAALWGSAVYTLPKYDVAPPVTEWSAQDLAIDLVHHLVYISAAAKAYELLDRNAD